MKLTPKHPPLPGSEGKAYVARVKKARTKDAEKKKTKKRQRRLKK